MPSGWWGAPNKWECKPHTLHTSQGEGFEGKEQAASGGEGDVQERPKLTKEVSVHLAKTQGHSIGQREQHAPRVEQKRGWAAAREEGQRDYRELRGRQGLGPQDLVFCLVFK